MLVKNYLKANKNRLWSLGSACHQKDTGEKSVSMHILSGSKTNHTQNQNQMDHFLLEQYFSSWERLQRQEKKNIKIFRLLSLVRCRVTRFSSVLSGYLRKQIRPAASNISKLEHQGCWLGLYLFVSISVYFLDLLFLTAQTVPH